MKETTTAASVDSGDPDGVRPFDLRLYYRTVRKHWLTVAAAVVVVVASTIVWTVRQPKIYRAGATLVIDARAPKVLQGVQEVVELGSGNFWGGDREFYGTQYQIIHSHSVARAAAERLGLTRDETFPEPNADVSERTLEDVTELVRRRTTVQAVDDSHLVTIYFIDHDPQRAAEVANALADAYLDYNLRHKVEGALSANRWLGSQVASLADKLRDSELRLHKYRKEKQLLDVGLDDRKNMTRQNLEILNGKSVELQTKKLELEALRRLIAKAREADRLESLPNIRRNAVVQKLRASQVELLSRRAELNTQYGALHPKMRAVDLQLEAVRKDYLAEIQNELLSLENEHRVISDQERSIRKVMEQEKSRALELSKLEVEYRPLAREAQNNENLYSLLTQRQKETGLTGLIRTNNVRILERARRPTDVYRPRLLVNVAMAALLGAIVGIGGAVIFEALDDTLRSQEHVEQSLKTPVLGVVPLIGGDAGNRRETQQPEKLSERDQFVLREPKSSVAEALRSIRTNLLFLSPDDQIRSFVVTSPGPKEGKTTTAISLATTMAMAGSKVLLVDTDLRRPRLHRSFSVGNDAGMSSAVVGAAKWSEILQPVGLEGLDVMTSGPIPPNPAELLHTERFRTIVAEMLEKYDRVIFDTPPVSAVTDPAIVGNLVDGVVFVVRAGHTSRAGAVFARRQLLDANARIVGTIVNGVSASGKGYQYYYQGNYRQGYGRYYGQEDEQAT